MAKVSGYVYVKESGLPVPGLIVSAFDYDPRQNAPLLFDFARVTNIGDRDRGTDVYQGLGDSLGSVLTNQQGEFSLEYTPADFRPGDPERRPDLVVLVIAPATTSDPDTLVSLPQSQRILHVTSLPRTNAARFEAFAIQLWQEQLEKFGLQYLLNPESARSASAAAEDERRDLVRTSREHSRKATAKKKLKALQEARRKANVNLANFVPTTLSAAARESPLFVENKEQLDRAQLHAIQTGLERRKSKKSRDLVTLGGDELARLADHTTESANRTLEIRGSAMLALMSDSGTGEAVRELTLAEICPHPSVAFLARPVETEDLEDLSETGDGGGTTELEESTAPIPTAEIAREEILARTLGQIHDLDIWNPDDHKGKRSTIAKLKASIDELKIAKGPADVTAIHDFHSVQVAWDHIWAEAYDQDLNRATRRLQQSWEQFKIFWIDENEVLDEEPWLTAAELTDRLEEKEEELRVVASAYPAPAHVNDFFLGMLTADFWNWLSVQQRESIQWVAENTDPVSRKFDPSIAPALVRLQILKGAGRRGGDVTIEWSSWWLEKVSEWRADFAAEILSTDYRRPPILDHDFGSWARTRALVSELRARLTEPYAFPVFATDSVNFGLVATYRQFWEPINYQVGELISTIPLAPKEKRQYTTKTTFKKSRAESTAEDSLFVTKTESTITNRAESEILRKAALKSSFDFTTQNQYGGSKGDEDSPELVGSSNQTDYGLDVESESRQVKKNFRESVLKAAQEYRKNRKVELQTSSEQTFESTTSGELSNPNEEIPVTYLFYELQRQYEVSEKLHRIRPVIFVAQDVPSPHEIDDDWLLCHEWILKRVLLDDQFSVAFEFLRNGFVGDNFAIEVTRDLWRVQRDLVKRLEDQLGRLTESQKEARDRATSAILRQGETQGIGEDIIEFFAGGTTDKEEARARVEAAERALEFMQGDIADIRGRLSAANDALQQAAQKLSDGLREQLNQRIAIDQLRVHVKKNILYYMHAIWDHEVPDQRTMRLYGKVVPFPRTPEATEDTGLARLSESQARSIAGAAGRGAGVMRMEEAEEREILTEVPIEEPAAGGTYEVEWVDAGPPGILWNPDPVGTDALHKRRLIEIADVGNPIGYWANYIILPLREPNYLTSFMAHHYVDSYFGVWDPDSVGNYTTDELMDYMECVRGRIADEDWSELVDELVNRLQSPRRDKDIVVVPSDQLFIESLPGAHPVIEDFKLLHRAVDVQDALAGVRSKDLENIRRAARLVEGLLDDPDIDKLVKKETIQSP